MKEVELVYMLEGKEYFNNQLQEQKDLLNIIVKINEIFYFEAKKQLDYIRLYEHG